MPGYALPDSHFGRINRSPRAFARRSALTQAARQVLSAVIKFANANMILNLTLCFLNPRYEKTAYVLGRRSNLQYGIFRLCGRNGLCQPQRGVSECNRRSKNSAETHSGSSRTVNLEISIKTLPSLPCLPCSWCQSRR